MSGGDHRWFKRSTGKKRPGTGDDDDDDDNNNNNNISYQFSNYVEFKLAKSLQLISTLNRTIFKKVRTETILKIYNTLVLPTFL